MRRRIPVDHSAPSIDQPFAVKIDKNLLDGANVIGIKSIALARPIAGAAEALQLFDDDPAMFVLPFQHAAKKFITSKVVARFFLGSAQMFFDGGLGPNAGVIGSWKPQHLEALHTRATGQNILNRVVKNMTHRKNSGHVRRRNHNRKWRL